MKVTGLRLRHFKRFEKLDLDFSDSDGLPLTRVLILGANGSGKTTVLQVIAAMLADACGLIPDAHSLRWPGWDLPLAGEVWDALPSVEVDVSFSEGELEETVRLASLLRDRIPGFVMPSTESRVTLSMQGGRVLANNPAELFQFRGRAYAATAISDKLVKGRPFEQVGRPFWYDVHRGPRSLYSIPERQPGEVEILDLPSLRQKLVAWQTYHQSLKTNGGGGHRGRDFYRELETAFQKVFPSRSFWGIDYDNLPGDALTEPKFYLHDGTNRYEVSEMSGGERAVMPILFDCVNWQMHRSVVMIDELELHLHPPQQQALLRALTSLGTDNQIILTTHSNHVYKMFDDREIIHLDDLI